MSKKKSIWKPLFLSLLLVSFMVLARIFDLGGRVDELREWIISLGTWGPLVYLMIYIAAVVLAVPGTVISILAGVLFGSFLGVILVSVGSTLGASLAFILARFIAREQITARFAQSDKFQRLDRMTQEQGAIIVAITRLIPLFPFNLLNYGFGLTRVSFWTYVFWSWLCMLPWTILFVVGADTFTQALSQGQVPWPLIFILLVTVVIIALLVRLARKKLSVEGGSFPND
ncbi:MAG: hypothetical protein GQ544_03570 [Candidatus Aminicenantes bacterium]|nr:hypothetical protein [Candidatus Aminicenantes bacterium]